MKRTVPVFLKKAPFLKIFPALAAGIITQWYLDPGTVIWLILFSIGVFILLLFQFFPVSLKFKTQHVTGISVILIFCAIGGVLVFKKDIRNNEKWFGRFPNPVAIVCTIKEPLTEKPKTFKTIASVDAVVLNNDSIVPAKGKLIIYFSKNDSVPPSYGSTIIITKKNEEVTNFIEGFDYKRYCLFKGITHQAFLKRNDFRVLPGAKKDDAYFHLVQLKEKLLSILKNNIDGEKELGLAEALLIGYKDDLDKSLVQSYSNTGVVHIIAISGLHLGLIYFMLSLITRPLSGKQVRWLRPVIIISILWLFSLLAGAQPSILRSAFMFTCIVTGESIQRQTSIYNSLAVSAFIIVCLNPFSLWDIGFQLSYAAVLSIVIFMRPVYNLIFFTNGLVDLIWKMNAVTISAQILTFPLCIYHFQQFPNYFLLSNFVAVPLSTMILFAEIILVAIFFITPVSAILGDLIGWLIRVMNNFILKIESLPYSVSQGITISIVQLLFLYGFIILLAYLCARFPFMEGSSKRNR